jgi:crotonobetainyl-CoA:carnitine CoA-transferase CaiB-like acyl-CoA transferase
MTMDLNRPLTGVRVLDFTNTVLGPTTTRYLADHGATVVKVESMAHPETTRIATPFAGEQPHLDRSGYFAVHNAGKLSLTLNMKHERARPVVERLIAWADILIESFAPGVMTRWHLSYGEVQKINPRIIMASTCLQGQTGPHSPHRGYGQMASAMAGWFELVGWSDGEPIGPYSAYSDFVDWNFLLVSLLAALDHRRRTGEGQYIDQSQLESSLWFMIPAILDFDVNGRIARRNGNRDPEAAPHGVYRCLGKERWCAISVTTDAQWQALCRVMDKPEWGLDERFDTVARRKANEDELDRLIENRTLTLEAEQVMEILQSVEVPAGIVQDPQDLFEDPQLRNRNHFVRLEHAEMGAYHIATAPFKLDKSSNNPMSAAPLMGEHTETVLKDMLGMSEDEITELLVDGVLE